MKETFLLPRYRGRIKAAVCFPSGYSAGMSSLAFQKLVALFSTPDFTLSRFFFDKKAVYSPDKIFPLNQADFIFFTISYEPDTINVLTMLHLAGISLDKKERKQVLIAGGIFPTINADFFSDIFDYQYRGEIEGNEDKILEMILSEDSTDWKEKTDFPFSAEIHPALPFLEPPHSVILSSDAGFSDTFLIEISRGCLFRCPFCMVSEVYESFRPAPYEKIKELVDKALGFTRKIGLVSALPNSHPQIKQIAHYILDKGGIPSFSSLRVDLIDEEFIEILKLSQQKTMTLAIEAGDQKIRNIIGKAKNLDTIKNVIALSLDRDIRHFKLYFMAGLPEDEKGAASVADLCLELRESFTGYAKTKGIMPAMSVDVSPFVPKPLTKWQNEKMIGKREYNEFLVELRKRIAPKGISLSADDYYMAECQFVISRGDKFLARSIANAIETNGSVKKIIKDKLVSFDK